MNIILPLSINSVTYSVLKRRWKKKAYLFTSVAADPKRLAPVRSRSLMVVTVTVWLGWSYCTDSVVLVIASSRSSVAASDSDRSIEDTHLKTSGPSKSVGCFWLVVGICGFQPTKCFVPLLQHFYIFLLSLGNRWTHVLDCRVWRVFNNILTSNLLLLALWSVPLWFFYGFLPVQLFSFPPFAYENQLNTPWQWEEGKPVKHSLTVWRRDTDAKRLD